MGLTTFGVVSPGAVTDTWDPSSSIVGQRGEPGTIHVLKSADGELREGGRLEIFVQVPEGRGMKFTPEVLRAEPARELRWIGRLPLNLFNGEHFFRLEAAGPGRTRFHHGERFTGFLIPFMGGTLRKTHRGYLLMNEALKRRVEGAPAPEAA